MGELSLLFSSKLQAYNLLSRRAYLLFLAATFATLALAPLVLKILAKSRLATVDRQQRAFSIDNEIPGDGADDKDDSPEVRDTGGLSIYNEGGGGGGGLDRKHEDSSGYSLSNIGAVGTWRRRL